MLYRISLMLLFLSYSLSVHASYCHDLEKVNIQTKAFLKEFPTTCLGSILCETGEIGTVLFINKSTAITSIHLNMLRTQSKKQYVIFGPFQIVLTNGEVNIEETISRIKSDEQVEFTKYTVHNLKEKSNQESSEENSFKELNQPSQNNGLLPSHEYISLMEKELSNAKKKDHFEKTYSKKDKFWSNTNGSRYTLKGSDWITLKLEEPLKGVTPAPILTEKEHPAEWKHFMEKTKGSKKFLGFSVGRNWYQKISSDVVPFEESFEDTTKMLLNIKLIPVMQLMSYKKKFGIFSSKFMSLGSTDESFEPKLTTTKVNIRTHPLFAMLIKGMSGGGMFMRLKGTDNKSRFFCVGLNSSSLFTPYTDLKKTEYYKEDMNFRTKVDEYVKIPLPVYNLYTSLINLKLL